MANWSLPTITDLYTNFLSYLKSRDDDATRMHDTRVTAATNVPDYSKRWNDTTKTFQNWLSSAWSSLVLGVAGGGTGASTAADARTNLDVYSKAEVTAAVSAGSSLSYVEGTCGNVNLTTLGAYYDGPTLSLAAGTWLIMGGLAVYYSAGDYNPEVTYRLYSGSTTHKSIVVWQPTNATSATRMFPIGDVVVLGSAATMKLQANRSSNGSASTAISAYSYLHAVKIA